MISLGLDNRVLSQAVVAEGWFDDEAKNVEMGFGSGSRGAEMAYESFLALLESGRVLGLFRGDQPVGYAYIMVHGHPHRVSEFFLFISPERRHSRLWVKALDVVKEHTLGDGSCRLETEILEKNTPAARALKHCGFKPEGISAWRCWMDGKPQNTVTYRLLKKEWRGG